MTEKVLVAQIPWGEITQANTYLYGTDIFYQERALHFVNHRVPSDEILHEWTSRTNYQASRTSPLLPLLVPNDSYQLVIEMTSFPEESYYLKLSFFNRQDEELSFIIQREQVLEFQPPIETYYYTIELISAGCERLVFHHLSLYHLNPTLPLSMSQEAQGYYMEEEAPFYLNLVADIIKEAEQKGESCVQQ